jgi:hypothetical protein
VRQGWCADPWDRYEQRWFSQGTPTGLVRTGGVEAQDELDGAPPPPVRAPVIECPPALRRPVWEVLVRRRPVRAGVVLTVAMVMPVFGFVLLAPPRSDRSLTIGAFVVVFMSVGVLVWVSQHAYNAERR